MFKKITGVLCASLTILSLSAGCGAKSQTSEGPAPTTTQPASQGVSVVPPMVAATPDTKSGSTVEIEFWHALSGRNGEIVQKIVDDYNAYQSGIKVNAVFQGDYYACASKLQAALIAGNQPDVIMLEVALVGQFASAGVLVDFNQYFSKEEVADFQEGLLVDTIINGNFNAVPFNRSTPVLYVNKTMLKNAGLNPEGPKTWAELHSFSKTIGEKNPGVVGCEIPVDIWFFESGLFQQGASVLADDLKSVNFNNEKGVTLIKHWQDMIKDGSMKPPVGKDYNGWDAAISDFVGQKTAMITVSTGYLKGLIDQVGTSFELGTSFLPAYEEGKFATPTGGANIAVLNMNGDERINASVEFVKYLTRKDIVGEFCVQTGYVPTTKSSLSYAALQEMYKEHPQYITAVDHLKYAHKRSIISGYREMAVTIQENIREAMLYTDTDPSKILAKASEEVTKILANE